MNEVVAIDAQKKRVSQTEVGGFWRGARGALGLAGHLIARSPGPPICIIVRVNRATFGQD